MILLVDDEPAILEAISSVLEDEGHAVATAGDGMAALDLLRNGLRPCLTILDLMMPRMNGWELRESMLADPDLADLPVAVVSALAVAGMRQLRLAGVISKPFQLEELVQLAERHCDPSHTGA
ncbi:MAG: response regulator [Candidatus Limnocylindria bacterium]